MNPKQGAAAAPSYPDLTAVVRNLEEVGSREVARLASGRRLLQLIGAPVLPMPEHIRVAAIAAMAETVAGDPQGLLGLRIAISDSLLRDYDLRADPEREILITNGAMHGLCVVLRALVGEGDEVIVPAPSFFFEGAIRLAGGSPVYVSGEAATQWRWDLDRIRRAVTPRTRVILLCNPNNPDGHLPSDEEMRGVVDIATHHGLVVVADESYQRFVYDGSTFTPLRNLTSISDSLVTVTSLSKNYAFANWRVGYIVAPDKLRVGMQRVFEWNAIYCSHVAQRAAEAAVTGPQDWLTSVIGAYEAKRDLIYSAVQESKALTAIRPRGGVFMLVDFSKVSADPAAIADQLLEHGVVAVPGGYFRAPTTSSRILFGGSESVLGHLAGALAAIGARTLARSRD